MRAKTEYGRLVEGSRTLSLAGETLLFLTITTKGKELSAKEALENYGKWTSKLLDAMYTSSKRVGGSWHYAQVTELQKRGHPHSHILTTWNPVDGILGVKYRYKLVDGKRKRTEYPTIRSVWFEAQLARSSLGVQYDISPVMSVEATSRYIAGYMFKPEMFNYVFPKFWKRVRYSHSWPKISKQKGEAFPLITNQDWFALSKVADVIDTVTDNDYEAVKTKILAGVVKIRNRTNDGLTEMERLQKEFLQELE